MNSLVILNYIKTLKIPHENEAVMQDFLYLKLKERFPKTLREFSLSKKDRIDFFIEGVGIECKVQGAPLRIYRQLERYCTHPEIVEIILITSKFIKLPKTIMQKPTTSFSVGRAWF